MSNIVKLSEVEPIFQNAPADIIFGSGAPSISAPKGSLYINIAATTTTTRLYINTDGSTTWATFTASA